ncbi:hypothetical protein Pint_07286 [Pistacia integerrima]|uniref:Uncharacterized protein n=1 Tax=Pistacia integerrima TaxID=434235 RepID=A0ACC0XU35_9ROSI|nr:hypothetical protein Pint_07286 [Pistacia integerrima]
MLLLLLKEVVKTEKARRQQQWRKVVGAMGVVMNEEMDG